MSTDSRFPHMGNDGFPGVDNIDVYAYENTFDYTRWQPNVVIKVCDVSWDSDYRDVPFWADDDTRDKWFDDLAGISQTLVVETRILPNGEVKLPLPFGVMSRYNYIEAVYPEFTGDGQPIAYENVDDRRARWFWFLRDVKSIAPNTTECILQLDYWTTFINSCSIPYMMLERGHWPMTRVSVDQYLSEPMNNTRYLLAPDVSYSDRCEKITNTDYVVFNDTHVYAVIFCTGKVEEDTDWGEWDDGYVPTGAKLHEGAVRTYGARHYTNQGVPSFETFAVAATDLNEFLHEVDTLVPQFKQTVQGICFLSDRLVNIGDSFTWMGFTLYVVRATQQLYQFELSRESFGLPTRYADIAKLYTAPYSRIEIANEDGVIATCNVEDLASSKMEVRFALSLAFPSIKIDCEVNGFNGPTTTYSFHNMSERTFKAGGSWYKVQTSWDVPIFAVTQDSWETAHVSTYYDRVQTDNDRATALGNANRSAATAQNNANASAKTAQENANASAATTRTNTENMNDRVQDNTNNTAERNLANERLQTAYLDAMNASGGYQSVYYDESNTRTNAFVARQKTLANDKASSDVGTTVSLNADLAKVENEALAATTVIGGASSIAGGAISGAVGGGITGGIAGAGAGMATGTVGGVVSAATATASLPIVAGKNSAVSTLSSTAAQALEGHVETFNDSMSTATQNYNDDMNTYKLTLLHHNNTQQTNMLDKQADNVNGPLASTKADSGIVRWNAKQTKDVQDANAERSYTTATGNATRSYNTATSNATRSYNAATDNAKDTSDNVRESIKNRLYQGGMDAPRMYGTMEPGNATVKPAGIWLNVVTQPIGALSSAGDQMLRYGYTLDQQVDVSDSGLSLMRNFTYWKASDIWLVGSEGVPENAQERLIRAFKDGLTVWEHPSDVGRASIYDNTKKAS